jgi:hypothetical protein
MSFRQFSTLAAIIGATNASGCTYDYTVENGGVGPTSNWAVITSGDCATEGANKCGGEN